MEFHCRNCALLPVVIVLGLLVMSLGIWGCAMFAASFVPEENGEPLGRDHE